MNQSDPIDQQFGDGVSARAQVEAFLQEISSLALRLRQLTAGVADTDTAPPTAKAILRLLQRAGAQTVPQLAFHRSTSRQNIQVIVNRLLNEGYVQIEDNPDHKRSGLVRINSKGLQLLERSTDPWDKTIEQLATRLPGQAITDASSLLRQLREVVQEMRQHRTSRAATPQAEIAVEPVHKERVHYDNELPVTLL